MFNIINSDNNKRLKVSSDTFVSNQDTKEHVKDFYPLRTPSSFQTWSNDDYGQADEEMDTWVKIMKTNLLGLIIVKRVLLVMNMVK